MNELHGRDGARRLRGARSGAFAACVLLAYGLAAADDGSERGVYGVPMPHGSRVTTDLGGPQSVNESDDFVVLVERGRTLTSDVTPARGSTLVPVVDVLRSDGSTVVTVAGDLASKSARVAARRGASARVRAEFLADATDAYRVRVRGANPPTSRYTIAIAVTGKVVAAVDAAEPDANGEYRFTIPARAGARIQARLTFDGAAPTPHGLLAPDGSFVPGAAAAVHARRGGLELRGFRIPAGSRFGDYSLAFGAPVSGTVEDVAFRARVTLPRVTPRRGRLRGTEPWLGGVAPATGVEGTVVVLDAEGAEDPGEGAPIRVRIGGVPAAAEFVDPNVRTSIRAVVPAGVAPGVHDVVLETATGQVAVLAAAFTVVPPPVATSVEPAAVPALGGTEVLVRGTGFRPGHMGVRIGGELVPVIPLEVTSTTVRFEAPPMDPGAFEVGVFDTQTHALSDVPETTVEWAAWASIGSITPGVVSVLGGETIVVEGFYFETTDRLLVEKAVPGAFEEIAGTYRTADRREFTAPVRPRGRYEVVVEDADGHRVRSATLTYFSYTDVSASLGLTAGAALDAASTALLDFDGDGDEDLFLARRGSGPAAATSATRALRNDGAAGFVDATASVLPAAGPGDDWRADRIGAADVNGDGHPDLVLATNDADVPAPGRSHVRFLMNELRSETAEPGDRVLRDRTADVFPPARRMTLAWGGSLSTTNDVDDWRTLDLWLGDLDGDGGRPDVVATTDRTFDNVYVSCAPYCASPYSAGYAYGLYWGGTRVFRWDPMARSGLGRYALDKARTPRMAGISIPIFQPPPGVVYPYCSPSSSCKGKFTPFAGRRLAVGRVDGDASLDIAVLADAPPVVSGASISVLQVGLVRANRVGWPTFPGLTDATPALTALGLDLRGDALAIGASSEPSGPAGTTGLVAVARSGADTSSSLRLLAFTPDADVTKPGAFAEVSGALLPPVAGGESWQADELRFADVDDDGDDDLVLLSVAVPAGGTSGLRFLRNLAESGGGFAPAFEPLVAAAGGVAVTGDALTIGDLDGNGLPDFLVSRGTVAGSSPATRVIATDR